MIRIGMTFQRPSDPSAPGPRRMQIWMVMRHLDRDVYECKLIDHAQDVMLSANPQVRTFREREILKHINNN